MTSVRTAARAYVVVTFFMAVARAAAQDPDAPQVAVRDLEITLDLLRAELAQGRVARAGGPAVPAGLGTDPMTGPVVTGSPFSADATTTVVQTLGDGTRIEQQATAKFYRDGTGRVRRELTIIGLDALNPSVQPRTVITFDSIPGDALPYSLDPERRTAVRLDRGVLGSAFSWSTGTISLNFTGGAAFFVGDANRAALERANDVLAQSQQLTEPERAQLRELERSLNVARSQGLRASEAAIPGGLKPALEQLGTRQIEGVNATGRRTTVIIPTDRIGNDRPMQITDEKWESAELGLVVYSRYSDPRTGVIEYRLTNVRRSEPAADLFQVPADYTVIEPAGRGRGRGRGVEQVPPPGGTPGGRGGARGGRSPQ